MKILKNAEQKNVVVNKMFFTDDEIKERLHNKMFFFLDYTENDFVSYDCNKLDDDTEIRIFVNNFDEMKVIYNKELGFYQTVGIVKATGENIPIIL